MKKIIAIFKNMQAFSFLVGVACGAAVGLMLFCYLVPHGPRAIRMMQHYAMHMKKEDIKNKEEFKKVYASTSMQAMMQHVNHQSSNPYMMGNITTENQFLQEMILHHESAVVMAKQVLTVPGIHTEVRTLAHQIIEAQNKEISDMKKWLGTFNK